MGEILQWTPGLCLRQRQNIMTQVELDHLRESCSFPVRIQTRLPEADETIESTRLDEVAFYEAAFQEGLRLPIHPTLEYWSLTMFALPSWFSMHGKYGLHVGAVVTYEICSF